MDYDENGLYFLTAKGKSFYKRLSANPNVALTGMKGADTMSTVAVSLKGKVREFGSDKLMDLFEKNLTDRKHCIRCGNCYEICPARAIIRKD